MTKLGVDLCELNDNHYIVMIDYNTKFHTVRQIEDETSMTVSKSIKSVLSEHGYIRGMYQTTVHALKVMNLTNLYRIMVLYTLQ